MAPSVSLGHGHSNFFLSLSLEQTGYLLEKMYDKSSMLDSQQPKATHIETAPNREKVAPRRTYAFGKQGKTLRFQISVAGALGFLLFGYDQGVLGVTCLAE